MTQQEAKTAYNKPLPVIQQEADFFWEKTKAGELWVQRCKPCNKTYFFPRNFCPDCHSEDVAWEKTDGKGTLYAFTIVHASMPAFKDMLPYIFALVEVQGGARLPTNLVGVEPDPAKVKIGMPLQVTFDAVTPEVTLYKFKPA